MNIFRITAVVKEKNKISYDYIIEGEWKKYFSRDILFWSEYEHNIEHVPESVAVLPLIGNIILMASVFHAEIHVAEIDRDFYESIEAFLEGYQKLSPQVDFKKQKLVIAEKVVHNSCNTGEMRSMLFFSGGVDAWSSLITHKEEKPLLVSIWGSDISSQNEEAWRKAEAMNQEIAASFGLDFISIRSSLRSFIDEKALNEYSTKLVRDNWWSAFQHSVGMMSLAAPCTEGIISILYFASTYSVKDEKCNYVTASDPMIDNKVAFAGCRVIHDGYNYTRHEKITRICKYSKHTKQKINIRVCYHSTTGDNCCRCEKCCNTIFSMLIEGFSPEDFGFYYDKDRLPAYLSSGMQELAKEEKYVFLSTYAHIQTAYRKKFKWFEIPRELILFYTSDIHHLAEFLAAQCNTCEAISIKLNYMDTVINEKKWLEKEYSLLADRLRETEIDWVEKKEWIAKLNMDILWLNERNSELIKENERLRRLVSKSVIHRISGYFGNMVSKVVPHN